MLSKENEMSNNINEMIREEILQDVIDLKGDDVWNVIFAIGEEFGIDQLPDVTKAKNFLNPDDLFVERLAELRFEARCQ